MFITKRNHLAALAAKDHEIATRDKEIFFHKAAVSDLTDAVTKLRGENASLLDELARLRAGRAKGNANLIAGGPRQKASAKAARAGE